MWNSGHSPMCVSKFLGARKSRMLPFHPSWKLSYFFHWRMKSDTDLSIFGFRRLIQIQISCLQPQHWINKPHIVSHSKRYKVLKAALTLQVIGHLCFPFQVPTSSKCPELLTSIQPWSWSNLLKKRIHSSCLSLVDLLLLQSQCFCPVETKSSNMSKIEHQLNLESESASLNGE